MKWKRPSSAQNPEVGRTASNNGSYKSAGAASSRRGGANSYAKWVGGGLGWAFGGPIGGILGYVLGSMFQGQQAMGGRSFRPGMPTTTGDFNVSLLVLTAAIMKADGTVKRSELEYVKKFYVANFGAEGAKHYIKLLGDILKKDFDVLEVSRQIGRFMDYSARLQLMHYLFGIALADGNADNLEVEIIERIAMAMGLGATDFQSIKAMFVNDTESAYKILGITDSVTDEEVKLAYREMAKKYHPDKVSHLGEDVKKAAEEKFLKVNEAYEAIKKERGIK
ncbi:MAG TPA: molecular chaperone DjiA [Bacteroidetes bacterium]|nr:molecular chaperone DjiA [Bacteroidota bacterium]